MYLIAIPTWRLQQKSRPVHYRYHFVASSRLSRLLAHPRIFRLFMKRNFDAYVLWPLDKLVQNWIVDKSTARNFTVCILCQFLWGASCFECNIHHYWSKMIWHLRRGSNHHSLDTNFRAGVFFKIVSYFCQFPSQLQFSLNVQPDIQILKVI